MIASGEGVRASPLPLRGTGIVGEGVKGYRQSLPILFTPYPFGVRTEDASLRAKGYATKGLPERSDGSFAEGDLKATTDGLPKDFMNQRFGGLQIY